MAVDLTTEYLGLTLKNPLVVAANPLTGKIETLQQVEAAGASAAVLPSLFEEQIEHEEQEIAHLYEFQTESFAESLTHFPELQDYNTGPREYLRRVEDALHGEVGAPEPLPQGHGPSPPAAVGRCGRDAGAATPSGTGATAPLRAPFEEPEQLLQLLISLPGRVSQEQIGHLHPSSSTLSTAAGAR